MRKRIIHILDLLSKAMLAGLYFYGLHFLWTYAVRLHLINQVVLGIITVFGTIGCIISLLDIERIRRLYQEQKEEVGK